MAYIIHDREALVVMGQDSPDANAIQNAINNMERQGFKLHSVVPQHHAYDDNGMSEGQEGPYFIFHNGEPQKRPRPLS